MYILKKLLKWIVIGIVALFIIGLIFGSDDAETTTTSTSPETVAEAPTETAAVEPVVVEEDDGLTNQQRNAVRSAEDYIDYSGFSRDGLINQLSSDVGDGYNVDDATIAVDSLNIDYNKQASRSAEDYLSYSGFSCDGLINQLSSEAGDKYTKEQAEYGAQAAGACD